MDASEKQNLERAFRSTFALPDDSDCEPLEFAKSAGWDSIAHMQLIAAIEKNFRIMLETDEILALSSFKKAMEIVERHGQENA